MLPREIDTKPHSATQSQAMPRAESSNAAACWLHRWPFNDQAAGPTRVGPPKNRPVDERVRVALVNAARAYTMTQ
jgi:hypothetical protein